VTYADSSASSASTRAVPQTSPLPADYVTLNPLMLRTRARPTEAAGGLGGRVLVGLAALVLVGAGLWAMLASESFYSVIATYPPYSRHFVHDLGAFQLGLGGSLALALFMTDALLVVLGANAMAGAAHFISHVVDRDLGGQPSDPLTIGLFALLLVGLTVWRARRVLEPERG